MSIVEIESEDQFTKLTKSDPTKLIALYFHTPWAAPCQTMNAVIKTLAQANPTTLFLSIDADKLGDISELFEVSAVPYFILIRNSTILKELSGADPKEFIAALNQFGDKPSTNQETNSSASISAATDAATSVPQESSASQNGAHEEESADALDERLKKLTTAAPVMLFMKGSPLAPQCGFLRQLVAILREHQVRFGFFDILKDDSVRQGLKTFSDWPTFPQLYVNGEFQGGLDIIKESLADDPEFFENALKAQ
ncbi:monothiol glutaredoxin grx4 [Scheffersomyces spartinae]|uniref:Monothiol glutaredoxin grx4 n=1 Tax=Scheffersomyces spartinae TaxID=45513 RepID=A0A9P8AIG0_9ASCO|nr:monothiol glutaredoxin grx4 [Scheffersomyces spartinae]KAG7193695.1 monothiol glutaredoxin grx4 [Scheffersomyces spartinae]